MDKPIKFTTMFLGRSASMGDLTWSVPLGCEIVRDDIPVTTHEPRDPPYAGEKLLELGIHMMAYVPPLMVRARGSVH